MGIDAKTLMLMSLAIALIAGASLLVESRKTRERAQVAWGFGFLTIALGCGLTPLRDGVSFQLGVWFADGLLIAAHTLFLLGSARFVGRPVPLAVWAFPLVWLPLAVWPADGDRTFAFAVVNASVVSILAFASARTLTRGRITGDWASPRLAAVFRAHGFFYAMKAAMAWVPGGFVDLVALKGVMIQVSLFEGIPVETLLLLVMATSVQRRREVHLISLAETDPLTGLLNRRGFDRRAAEILRRVENPHSTSALLLCDLDHFKTVNDTFGHAAGDTVLIAFADLLRVNMPSAALFARYGGDEFVALLPDIDASALHDLSAAIRSDFRAVSLVADGCAIPTTVTMGMAWNVAGADLSTLLQQADAAAYEAKRRGRDQIVTHMAPRQSASGRAAPRRARA